MVSWKGYCWHYARICVPLIVIVATSTPSLVYYNRFRYATLYQTQQYVISDIFSGFSTIFCDRYGLDTVYSTDAFLINGEAKISQTLRDVVNLKKTDAVYNYTNGYYYHPSFLRQGSSIHVKGCKIDKTLPKTEILIFRGDSNWKDWDFGNHQSSVEKSVDITDDCSFKNDSGVYDVTSDDNYYVVRSPWEGVDQHITFNKTVYDLSQTVRQCRQQTDCDLELDFGRQQEIIIRIGGKWSYDHTSSVKPDCHLRFLMWFGLYFILPVTVFLAIGLVCCGCYCKEKWDEEHGAKVNITRELVNKP
ncbi:hypothetical protein SNE40_021455 [Patella caerulea]|uniref:E3 ubiquitin-protein ligase APD1-4 middle domain-containing protein n=1 Tax=Patella caerulea TaxID=87958 RepID=A0AAN8GB91_PATCE